MCVGGGPVSQKLKRKHRQQRQNWDFALNGNMEIQGTKIFLHNLEAYFGVSQIMIFHRSASATSAPLWGLLLQLSYDGDGDDDNNDNDGEDDDFDDDDNEDDDDNSNDDGADVDDKNFEGDDDDIIDDDIDDDDDDGDVDNPDENNDDDNDGVKADDDGLPQRKRPRLPSQLSCYALLPSLVLSINNDNDIYSREHISTIQRIHNEGWEEEKTIPSF